MTPGAEEARTEEGRSEVRRVGRTEGSLRFLSV